jgi:hypothetical protein
MENMQNFRGCFNIEAPQIIDPKRNNFQGNNSTFRYYS